MKLAYLFLSLSIVFAGCRKTEEPAPVQAAGPKTETPQPLPLNSRYVDITQQAGVSFVHNHGGYGKKLLPESMGSGCAFFDFDNDDQIDILLVNSMDWPDHRKKTSHAGLFRNNGDGTFSDVTKQAGLAIEMYGIGTSIADYDNDADADIYITALGPDRLFRNNGNGTFTDVTESAGIKENEFGASSTWFDYDKDGLLDLFVGNYVKWSLESDLFCTLDGVNKSYCTPESYPGASSRLYRNQGDGKFSDVTQKAGLQDNTSKALGVIAFDYDLDGWMDLFVANDTQPNKLYHNKGNGTFEEKGVASGVAFSEAGVARAGMGVDAADYDRKGYPGLLIGNFSNEMLGLYHNEGKGLFIDEAPASTVGQSSLLTLTFGAFFFDFDLDGWIDILAANGHVHDDIQKVQPRVTYAQPPHLFRNLGGSRFDEVTTQAGLATPMVARGSAYGDIDRDGDLDILISNNGGPARLFRNDGGKNNYLRFKTVGSKSNRDGIGTRIVIQLEDGAKQWEMRKGASSYASQNEPVVTFGLGAHQKAKVVEVFWPSGQTQRLENVAANQTVVLEEK